MVQQHTLSLVLAILSMPVLHYHGRPDSYESLSSRTVHLIHCFVFALQTELHCPVRNKSFANLVLDEVTDFMTYHFERS